MHLDHLDLCASDVPALTRTLQQHFGYRFVQTGPVPEVQRAANPWHRVRLPNGADGSCIVITHIDAQPDGRSSHPPQFHFGLIQESADAVHAKHAELTAGGYDPGKINAGLEVSAPCGPRSTAP